VTSSSPPTPDISTWDQTGHFHFVLTWPPPPRAALFPIPTFFSGAHIRGGQEPIYGFFRARHASTGSPLFTFQVGGPIGSGPVIADGMVFVGVGVRVAPATPEADGVFAFAP